ncbi:hypothetical protein EMIT0P74_20041 [Pseudomonas sp. IT-P74]
MCWLSYLGVFKRLFSGCQRYVWQATSACVIAYSYARIRRLVCLGGGFYRWPVAAKQQRSGLVARLSRRRAPRFAEFYSLLDGGHA